MKQANKVHRRNYIKEAFHIEFHFSNRSCRWIVLLSSGHFFSIKFSNYCKIFFCIFSIKFSVKSLPTKGLLPFNSHYDR